MPCVKKGPGFLRKCLLLKARLNLVIGALLFSTGGVAIKTATLTGWQLSCFRSCVAGIAVLLLVPELFVDVC